MDDARSSDGNGSVCFIKSRVKAATQQEVLLHFMVPSADKLYGDNDFLFELDLAPAPSIKTTSNWLADYGITAFDWPANWSDLNPSENLWGFVKRKTRDTRFNNTDELKAGLKALVQTFMQNEYRLLSIECRNEHTCLNVDVSIL